METLTTDEARRLIEIAKNALIEIIDAPQPGTRLEFDASGKESKELFTVDILRGKINRKKYNYGARIKKNGIILLELHVNAGNMHVNPNGEKFNGSHWHYYTQEDGLKNAFPVPDLDSQDFIDNTLLFLEKFHIVNNPKIQYQAELF